MMEKETVTALSLWQPWATFMVARVFEDRNGHEAPPKRIETRSWQRGHKGRLIIHAAKYKGPNIGDIFHCEETRDCLGLIGYKPDGSDLPRGCLIGEVEIAAYASTEALLKTITPLEYFMGDYSPGRWGWVTAPGADREYNSPVAWRGAQGLFRVPADVLPEPVEAK